MRARPVGFIMISFWTMNLSAIAFASEPNSDQAVVSKEIGNLPDVAELLGEACEQIASVDGDLGTASLYRQTAALYGRLGDVKSAYETLGEIWVSPSINPQTMRNSRRVGFLEMVEDVALHRNAETAVKIIEDCPRSYRKYSDDAFGRVALSAAKRGDAKDAWSAIERIKQPDGLYPYELVVALTLEDKERGRAVLRRRGKKAEATDPNGRPIPLADPEILWFLSLYKWAGMEKEVEQLLDQVSATANAPDKRRAEILNRLKESACDDSHETKEVEPPKQITAAEILALHAEAAKLSDPKKKAERLLRVAKLVFEFDQSPDQATRLPKK